MRGIVVKHIPKLNYGFIACEDEVERFFHAGMCHPSTRFHQLEVSDRVECDPVTVQIDGTPKPRAANVRLLGKGERGTLGRRRMVIVEDDDVLTS